MEFIIKNPQGRNIVDLMRQVGYYFQKQESEESKSELAFIRPLAPAGYPRFHIYLRINPETKEVFLNLHLDQKKPIYKGTTAHSGEYDGEVIERETERIKKMLQN